jgi:hypothetical protein
MARTHAPQGSSGTSMAFAKARHAAAFDSRVGFGRVLPEIGKR